MNGASEVVQQCGQQGHEAGQFDVSAGIALLPVERPTDVARAPNSDLYVVDWGKHRIQVFTQTGPEQ